MTPVWNIPLGAPGIYRYPDTRLRQLTGVRMDICAFFGVAPRGPSREAVLDQTARNCKVDPRVVRQSRRTVPVRIESFDDFRHLFGAFEGPGLLPYAVAAFFDQGGQVAYVARIVHQYPSPAENQARVASGQVPGVTTPSGPLGLRARNEGLWGNLLQVSIAFRYTPLNTLALSATTVSVGSDQPLPAGTLLRLTLTGNVQVLRFAAATRQKGQSNTPGAIVEATLDQPAAATPISAEIVEADCFIDDQDGRQEQYVGQGLSSLHPRWLGATLCYDSNLVFPDQAWLDQEILPKPDEVGAPFSGGEDAYEKITPEDFFDDTWTPGDDEPGDGVQSLANLCDVSLLAAPDLYSPKPLADLDSVVDPPSTAGPTFAPCLVQPPTATAQAVPNYDLDGLRLDPQIDLDAIIALQSRLVEFAEQQQSLIVLLDVPPGLHQRQILNWRSKFNSAYVAAYHPWLSTARADDRRDVLIHTPPAAIGAGIIAQRELAYGVPYGPANELAVNVVNVDDEVSPARHDELHPRGINVFLRERDGVRLTAARTLSLDPQWRQLSVRRLVTMIKRTLYEQTQWLVFEPNDEDLRGQIHHLLTAFLRRLFRLGAFKGATEAEAFFVRCDEGLNPPVVVESGQVIALVGVAPAEPLEFIVLRLSREGDGTLNLEEA